MPPRCGPWHRGWVRRCRSCGWWVPARVLAQAVVPLAQIPSSPHAPLEHLDAGVHVHPGVPDPLHRSRGTRLEERSRDGSLVTIERR